MVFKVIKVNVAPFKSIYLTHAVSLVYPFHICPYLYVFLFEPHSDHHNQAH